MSQVVTEPLAVVVEREIPFSPDKIWRALTQPHLIAEWLMKNDFEAAVGHSFKLEAEWGVVNCKVQAIEPSRTLSYTWAAQGLETVVTWTLTPVDAGTRLRMEQVGFQPDQKLAYRGATAGWPRFFESLEGVVARID